MNHTEILTKYVGNFVDELAKSGLRHVVISPGSRSTPLAMLFSEHHMIKEWVIIDERSAAFFALGLAKQTMQPVALVCTSGTAAANYYPAIIEAHYSRVPLVVLTADRPHELRDVGAPQAIEQIKMYGDYVKWFHEMALPEATPDMLRYVRSKASRAMYVASEGNAGPVHLNFPFREPLVPDLDLPDIWGQQTEGCFHAVYEGKKALSKLAVDRLVNQMLNKNKGVIVCGPQIDPDLADVISELAQVWQVPILADPLSQLRAGSHPKTHIIENYDALLKDPHIRQTLKPDFILRFGAMPVSKSFRFFMEDHSDVTQWIVEHDKGFRDPVTNRTEYIYADPVLLCQQLIHATKDYTCDDHWFNQWNQMNLVARDIMQDDQYETLTEGEAVRSLLNVIPSESTLFIGNSMAVRDLDSFFMPTDKEIKILANRGTSGIDGVVSSACGAAAVTPQKLTLVIGDLSFYHDLNGLWAAKHYQLDLTILLINNNGGGIFSFLPQAKQAKHFETLFGTPLNIDFKPAVTMYGGDYQLVTDKSALETALTQSYETDGLSVIEVQTDREENKQWRQQKWQAIKEAIQAGEW